MRTTLDIDADVLAAVKAISAQRGVTTGKVLSDLVRQALTARTAPATRNGVPLFPVRRGKGKVVTLELVNRLRDELL